MEAELVLDTDGGQHNGLVVETDGGQHHGLVVETDGGQHHGLVVDTADGQHHGLVVDSVEDTDQIMLTHAVSREDDPSRLVSEVDGGGQIYYDQSRDAGAVMGNSNNHGNSQEVDGDCYVDEQEAVVVVSVEEEGEGCAGSDSGELVEAEVVEEEVIEDDNSVLLLDDYRCVYKISSYYKCITI